MNLQEIIKTYFKSWIDGLMSFTVEGILTNFYKLLNVKVENDILQLVLQDEFYSTVIKEISLNDVDYFKVTDFEAELKINGEKIVIEME